MIDGCVCVCATFCLIVFHLLVTKLSFTKLLLCKGHPFTHIRRAWLVLTFLQFLMVVLNCVAYEKNFFGLATKPAIVRQMHACKNIHSLFDRLSSNVFIIITIEWPANIHVTSKCKSLCEQDVQKTLFTTHAVKLRIICQSTN